MDPDERFDVLDYCVFGGMLSLSALIGVYFAFCAKQKQNTTKEYLMGGKKMGIFPMSMSLVASSISGISLLGYPSEMFTFGTQFWMGLLGEILAYLVTYVMFLPVLYNLQVTSVYEYLQRRYSPALRKLGSILFLTGNMLYIPIVIYVPALAFAQVTGMSLSVLIPLVCVVCIFYTCLGGLKAVVWTDTLQTMLILLGVLTVSTIGTINAGGIAAVWERAVEGDRIEFFNMDLNPTLRHTFWTVVIGKFSHCLSHTTMNQSIVQRYLAMPNLKEAKRTMIILIFGMLILVSFCCYTGLVIFAAFYDCDPVLSQKIKKYDQILPYFIIKTTSDIPALPGIFVAGVFSAALSTMSTCLNSMTGVLFEDFIRPRFKTPISEARASFYMKVIVVIIGSITIVLASLVDKLGGIIQTSASLSGITAGTLLGIFLCGTLLPWINEKGAMVGGIVSALFVGWISIGTQVAITKKEITFQMRHFSIEGCDNVTLDNYYNSISNYTTRVENLIIEEPFFLYKVSYLYYPMIGVAVCVIVGFAVSVLTGLNKPRKMDPDLLSPVIHNFISFVNEKEMVNIKLMQGHKDSVDLNNIKRSTDGRILLIER